MPASEGKQITVRVTRAFRASPEWVFDAWLDPSRARKFLFATETGEIVRCDIDERVGGTFTIVDRREGKDVLHTGKYVAIDRQRGLVFDFAVPEYSSEWTRVAIDIEPVGTGCVLTLTHEGVLEEYTERTTDGWPSILARLEKAIT
jgi:uncharacterized protein YndB with AHSA1/START domain